MPVTLEVGRDLQCDVVLADASVSRVHAELVLFDDGRLFVRDRGSQNGTVVVRDGARQQLGAQFVEAGDSVLFGDLDLSFETLREMAAGAVGQKAQADNSAARPAPEATPHLIPKVAPGLLRPGQALTPSPAKAPNATADDEHTPPGLREFLPGLTGFHRLRQRGLVLPILGFAALVAFLFGTTDPDQFINVMGVGICLSIYVLLYRSCGQRKPWIVVGGVMAAEAFIMMQLLPVYAFVFRRMTGTNALAHSKDFLSALVGHFVAAGLMEELMKMTPVIVLIALAGRTKSGDVKRWGVTEPLDAIVYACAAATVFVLIETLRQYVPDQIRDVLNEVAQRTNDPKFGAAMGYLQATQLAVARTLDSASGHLAFSGYFGYYVGLGLLRPRHQIRYWIGGYVGAAAIHGLSNALALFESVPLTVAMNFVSVSFLAAVVLNARRISPTRDQNFATKAYRSVSMPSSR